MKLYFLASALQWKALHSSKDMQTSTFLTSVFLRHDMYNYDISPFQTWHLHLGTPASSTTKTGGHGIAEILLKVALKHQKSKNLIRTTSLHRYPILFPWINLVNLGIKILSNSLLFLAYFWGK
jgi:hypothetical protein